MKLLASEKESETLLSECASYVYDTDLRFAKAALDIIGQLPIQIPSTYQKSVDILLLLLKDKKSDAHLEDIAFHLTQLQRHFPFETYISQASASFMKTLLSVQTPCALWLLGEFCEHIPSPF